MVLLPVLAMVPLAMVPLAAMEVLNPTVATISRPAPINMARRPGTPPPPQPPPPTVYDEWAEKYYRNWTYYKNWAVPPSCLDKDTCSTVKKNFTDIAQVL